MEAISYPIVDNGQGDLYTSFDPQYLAIFRGWLLCDVVIGEREFYPEYGSEFQLFSPTASSSEIESNLLENNLNQWCVTADDEFSYEVVDDTIIDFDFSIKILFPED